MIEYFIPHVEGTTRVMFGVLGASILIFSVGYLIKNTSHIIDSTKRDLDTTSSDENTSGEEAEESSSLEMKVDLTELDTAFHKEFQ